MNSLDDEETINETNTITSNDESILLHDDIAYESESETNSQPELIQMDEIIEPEPIQSKPVKKIIKIAKKK